MGDSQTPRRPGRHGPSGARHSTLWGGRKHRLSPLAAVAVVAAALTATPSALAAEVPVELLDAAKAHPEQTFDVIVLGKNDKTTKAVKNAVAAAISDRPGKPAAVTTTYSVVNGLAATLTGEQLASLSGNQVIESIAPDARTRATGVLDGLTWSNPQLWPKVSQTAQFWSAGLQAPTIAVVDSGVDRGRAADFGARVVQQVRFTDSLLDSGGDGYGHGTLVAGLAAGAAPGYSGAAPNARIVSLDVLDDTGAGTVSDVIEAADWIYRNKDLYGIRVANFSLTAASPSTFMYDPLDRAVERLWLSGVVVVAAAGNYAVEGTQSGVLTAPANDPFIITVGATDTAGTVGKGDDFIAPWSAWGYTFDGFAKPEISAPGRYMNGPVPAGAVMSLEHPERLVAPGYMWMSGTSFAAPVVSGAAAYLLAARPWWGPDQVKGALMLTATPVGSTRAGGVGQINADVARGVTSPPNPNAALNGYVVSDPTGGAAPVFDAAAWRSAAWASAAWSSAAWSSAAWSSAAWSSAAWSSAAWSSAAWSSAAWSSAAWSSAASVK